MPFSLVHELNNPLRINYSDLTISFYDFSVRGTKLLSSIIC
jgi:hypothetical protein